VGLREYKHKKSVVLCGYKKKDRVGICEIVGMERYAKARNVRLEAGQKYQNCLKIERFCAFLASF
jgi:hypothetical protein